MAERELEYRPKQGGRRRKIVVRLGAAVFDPRRDSWRVDIQINGPKRGQEFRSHASGVDSMGAVVAAIWLVSVCLRGILNDCPGDVTFLDDPDLGFYLAPPEGYGPEQDA
ncbi:DUF6968 family protein [Polyangium aurulentum]|uniref:DUF6968 family protein n=1 Tax=Polyangium aurulentum TaxID=2567896 RepID=UPI003B8335BD